MNRRRWLRRVVLGLLLVVLAAEGFSLLLRAGWLPGLHAALTRRLEANFGRPVEVSYYRVALVPFPALEAHTITVGEDPAFGHEHFLWAERLRIRPRWRALLAGRLELGTLSLERPSLNLVRIADGRWNVEHWLPPGTAAAAPAPDAPRPGRLYRIEVDEGRVNFKRGPDKHPFALVDVTGSVDQETVGRWRLALEATLRRAGVALQEPGRVRVQGYVAGTSLRLQPAELEVIWREASLSDALRLWRGYDYGARGRIEGELRAESRGGWWDFGLTARVREAHRWDLPPRAADPGADISAEGAWWPAEARVELRRAQLEGPRSQIRASGSFHWSPPAGSEIQLTSAGVGWADLLDWLRAFRPGVAEGAAMEGTLAAEMALAGWPPRVRSGTLASRSARLRVPGLGDPLRLEPVTLLWDRGRIQLSHAGLSLSGGAASLRWEGTARPGGDWPFTLRLAGETREAESLLIAAAALGWQPVTWPVEGAAEARLTWQGTLFPLRAPAVGSVELADAALHPPFLSQPIALERAQLELAPGVGRPVRVRLTAAQALGARWAGELAREGPAGWTFSLRADRLDVARLRAALAQPAQQSRLARLLGRGGAAAARPPTGLVARGQLQVAELAVAPYQLRNVAGELQVATGPPWRAELRRAGAGFYGGTLRGTWRAAGGETPAHSASVELAGVDLAALAAASENLSGRFAGVAGGSLTLEARGTDREAMLASLNGEGRLELRDAVFRGLDLGRSLAVGRRQEGASRFATATAEFHIAAGRVHIERWSAVEDRIRYEGAGTVAFSRTVDLEVRTTSVTVAGPPRPAAAVQRSIRITGPLEQLEVAAVAERPR